MTTRDLPRSPKDLLWGWTKHLEDEITFNKKRSQLIEEDEQEEDHEKAKKVQMKSLWPAFCSGAGLFSDGYVNNSIGVVSTCLSELYPKEYVNSNAISNVTSIAYIGIVVGQLVFGYISDRVARKGGMLFANVMLIFFTVLCCAGTWGAHGSPYGLFAALTAFRFFLGIAIGAEYPTASVIASEFANQLPSGKRNRYFCWFTNFMIDTGFIVSSFVPLVLLWIFTPKHLTPVWRLTLGLGVFPPLILFFLRLKLTDSESFQKSNFKKAKKVPYLLIIKFYWFRLLVVSLIWFTYDFSAYSFGTYSSYIVNTITGGGDLYKSFGWNVVFNLFYIPGAFLGALAADYIGPRLTVAVGVGLQGIIGFIMAACYPSLKKHVGPFVVVFGIFSTLGEFGPGDNIGLLASKTSATAIRGQYYGIAAAVGKIGAFIGIYIYPVIQKNAKSADAAMQNPFYVSSSLCIFAAILALFFCPSVGQNVINKEDREFMAFLKESGYDITQMSEPVVVDEQSSETSEATKKHTINVETQSKESENA